MILKKQFFSICYALGLFLCCLPQSIWAQEKDLNRKDRIFNNEFAVGIGFQGRKLSLGLMYAKHLSQKQSLLFSLEATEIASSKEKRNNNNRRSARNQNYIYGKVNNLYVTRLGIGQKFYFSEKNTDSDLSISFSYQGGVSLGILKPYYLTLYYPTSGPNPVYITSVESYTAENSQYFLNPNHIAGAGGGRRGWDQLSTKPGLFAKASLWLDLDPRYTALGALEIGAVADAFFSPIYILAETKVNPLMFHVYATVYFGGRW